MVRPALGPLVPRRVKRVMRIARGERKRVAAAVGDLAVVVYGVAIHREFDGGVINEERVRGLAGEFGADHFPSAVKRVVGRRGGGVEVIRP